jgi:bis(5'-nucleosyl)-tetraphosphatase (symmetrical)
MLRSEAYDTFLEEIYGDLPNSWSGKLSGFERLRFIVNALTRMRMIDAKGRIDFSHTGPPDKAAKGLVPWFEIPDARWRDARVVFGHWSALGLIVRDDLIAVDTGCVWGRQLTAVKLTKKPKVTSIQCPG